MARYFERSEFACKCGCDPYPTVDYRLIEVLDSLRYAMGAPISVTSGVRCKDHNRAVGGSTQSQHLRGKAADIVVRGTPAHVVQSYLEQEYPDELGIGSYESFTHVDTRPSKARWTG